MGILLYCSSMPPPPIPLTSRGEPALDEEQAWQLLLKLRELGSSGTRLLDGQGLRLQPNGDVDLVDELDATVVVNTGQPNGHNRLLRVTDKAACLLDLFFPLCTGPPSEQLVVAHLAQTLDGRIATNSGASKFISGQQDLEHTHRLRALFDAVVVGVRTGIDDNPRLTTRHVAGPHATRVCLDPQGKLPPTSHLLLDTTAPTIVVTGNADFRAHAPHVSVIRKDLDANGQLDLSAVLEVLRVRGLPRVFVEGGGVTVSRFLEARLLQRLHIAVAPSIFGSGRAAFGLPAIDSLHEQVRLDWRPFHLGKDLLLDCQVLGDDHSSVR